MAIRRHDYHTAEACAIVEAIRELQNSPELMDAARTNTPAAMDRLGLSGTVRHAVAAALALSISGVALMPGTPIYWTS